MSPSNGGLESSKLIVNSHMNLSSKTLLCRGFSQVAMGRIHGNAINSGLVSWIDEIQNAFKADAWY
jgi:hypothetical protein